MLAARPASPAIEAPAKAGIVGGRVQLITARPTNARFRDVASMCRIDAKQRKQTTAPPKPHGRRWR